MSHFSKLETQFKDLTLVQKAVNDLNCTCQIGENMALYGYSQNKKQVDALIRFASGYDIGLKKNIKTESYDIVADWYGVKTDSKMFINQLKQRYAYYTIYQAAEQQGLIISDDVCQEDGSIKLIVRQWT